jgi:hypothetical protein
LPKKQQKVYQDLQKSGKITIFAAKLTNDEKNFLTNYSLYGYDIDSDSPTRHEDRTAESD